MDYYLFILKIIYLQYESNYQPMCVPAVFKYSVFGVGQFFCFVLFCFNDKLFQIYFPLFLIESTSFKYEQQVNSKYLFLIIFSSEIMITRGHLLVNCSDDMLLHSNQQIHSFHFHYNFIITMQLGFLERILMSIL